MKQRLSSQSIHDRMGLMIIPCDEAELKLREMDSEVSHEVKLKVKPLVPPSLATTEITLTPVNVLSPSCFWTQYGDVGELEKTLASCGPTLSNVAKVWELARGEIYLCLDTFPNR